MPTLEPQAMSGQLVAPQDPVAFWGTAVDGVAKTLAVHENVLLISIGAGLSGTLTLPDVYLAKGQTYTIRLLDDGAGSDKTITVITPQLLSTPIITYSNGEIAYTIAALTSEDDLVVLYSDGYHWHQMLLEAT